MQKRTQRAGCLDGASRSPAHGASYALESFPKPAHAGNPAQPAQSLRNSTECLEFRCQPTPSHSTSCPARPPAGCHGGRPILKYTVPACPTRTSPFVRSRQQYTLQHAAVRASASMVTGPRRAGAPGCWWRAGTPPAEAFARTLAKRKQAPPGCAVLVRSLAHFHARSMHARAQHQTPQKARGPTAWLTRAACWPGAPC